MKKIIPLLTMTLGIFALAGLASASIVEDSASSADRLQPASSITYDEDLIVSGIGKFDSAYIGSTTGEGGVTFFNGTMINASEGSVPLTMGDDVRIDGMIWRGTSKGTSDDMPLKIADTLMPALDNINDIGTEDMRWRNLYLSNTLSGVSANFNGITSGNGAFSNELTVADYIAVGGGYGSTGATFDSKGNGKFNGDLTIDGDINWNSAKTNYLSISGATCTGQGVFSQETCSGDGDTTLMRAYWNVNLPHGATVTSFSGNYRDNDASDNLVCTLERHELGWENFSSSAIRMASFTTSGASTDYQTETINTIEDAIINFLTTIII